MEAILSPNTSWLGPPHLHREQEERYEVLSGTLDVLIGGEEKKLRAGERLVVPVGVPHTFGNYGTEEVRFVSEHRLALRFQEMMEAWYAPVKAERIERANSLKGLLMYAAVAQEYERELVFSNPALRLIQRILAVLGRSMGYGPA